jgi:hypothetical protein
MDNSALSRDRIRQKIQRILDEIDTNNQKKEPDERYETA